MKALTSCQDEIKIAEELLAKANADYKAAALEAFEEGRLEEIIEASWREIHSESGVRIYCDKCFVISPNALWHERCPHCGAHMTNSRIVYKTVERPSFLQEVNEKVAPQAPKEKVHIKRPQKEDMIERAVDLQSMYKEITDRQISQSDFAKKAGIPQSSFSQYVSGRVSCNDERYERICAAYKECVGHEFVRA